MSRESLVMLVVLTTTFINQLNCDLDADEKLKEKQIVEGTALAKDVTIAIFSMFQKCLKSPMPDENYAMENLQKYLYSPAKTTVGFGPKFTLNRKFFGNLIQTTAYKEMVAHDEEELRRNMISKAQHCDQAIMDQELMRDFYDREVDQSKM